MGYGEMQGDGYKIFKEEIQHHHLHLVGTDKILYKHLYNTGIYFLYFKNIYILSYKSFKGVIQQHH